MRLVYRSEPLFRQVPAQIARRLCKIEALSAEHLLADKGYDSDAIVEQAIDQGMSAVIPPRKNIKEQRSYDKHLYRRRHLVENAVLHLKRWRGIGTRYAKTSHHF